MPISFTGAFSASTLTVPDVYINAPPPGTGVIRPALFGAIGVQGGASWGPVNVATVVPGPSGLAMMFGLPVVRVFDLATACNVVLQVQNFAGIGGNLIVNRVTDGTDLAATTLIGGTGALTLTSKYTGSLPNGATAVISTGMGNTTAVPAWKLTYQQSQANPEVYDGVTAGVAAVTVTPGTGATKVPTITFSAPQLAGGVQATGTASLKVVGSPTVVGAGTGYAVGDTVTAGNGVFLTVATLSGSGIATVTLANGGSLTSGSVPTNPVAQVTTTGSGTGATFTLAWGLGPVTITQQGNGYGSATAAFGSGAGSGTAAVAVAPWSNFASAINNGASALRGPSQLVVASAGSSVTAPTNGQTATMSGGTDGASAISSAQMMGVDAFPRTGIYAFRNSGISDLVIADFSDTTQESTLITFGQSEGILVHSSGPSGETVATGATTEATNGSNGLFFKRYLGDWCYWPDNQNGVQRVITPSTFGAALMSTLQPQQSGLNKPIPNIQATQRGKTGIPYGSDELAQAEAAGIEIICNPIPAGPGFGMRLGITNSSNGTANTDNWPRLTSFLARSLAGVGALGTLIGQTITAQFFANGYAMIDAFLAPMKSTENGAQIIQNYDIIFGPGNNPQSQTALGIVIAQVNIQYLGIARIFLVNMQGGATVVIPTNANIAAAAALVS